MGSAPSQEEIDRMAQELYEETLKIPCLLPDVGIDESILKYSGMNSNTALQAYSTELVNSVPGFIEKLGTGLGALNSIPNAVGLGALIISIILEIIIKSSTQKSDETYGLLKRVFGEEKASAVRDTMSESVTRYQTFLNNDQRLLEELRRLETQLSGHLTSLRNSLLYDGQMSTRGFKIWVNGASFHTQMRIHEARLSIQAGKNESDYVDSIKVTISLYLQDLDNLLREYKTYLTSNAVAHMRFAHSNEKSTELIKFKITKTKCEIYYDIKSDARDSLLFQPYLNLVFSNYEPISSLRDHFSNTQKNLNSLINQLDAFTLPSTT